MVLCGTRKNKGNIVSMQNNSLFIDLNSKLTSVLKTGKA